MSKVFVLDTKKRPLAPCHPARARQLLRKGKAAVYRMYPFTIILNREVENVDSGVICAEGMHADGAHRTAQETETFCSQPLRLKIDPGSKTTGLAILNDRTGEVVWAAELQHRGQQIKASLDSRRAVRRSRRNRKTRYRKPRFNNRRRPRGVSARVASTSFASRAANLPQGWLPPSLMSRVYSIQTWVARLRRYCPIKAISMELAKFDTQKLENPEISGVEYLAYLATK